MLVANYLTSRVAGLFFFRSSLQEKNCVCRKVLFGKDYKSRQEVIQRFRKANSSHTITAPGYSLPLLLSFGFGGLFTKSTDAKKMTDTDDRSPELIESLRQADQLYDENHFDETIEILLKLTESAEVKWRLARVYFANAKVVDKKGKEENIRAGYKCAKEALELDPENYATHKWYAVLLDANAEVDGIKARASNLVTVKHHMEEAIRLNPNDPTSWHMIGYFEFGLADMPWFQLKIVETLFAAPPSGTFPDALKNFLKAEEIKPDFFATNKLMIGKCYLKLKDLENARKYIELAANTIVHNADDKKCKEEATKLLAKFN